jgi:hypothetical protein
MNIAEMLCDMLSCKRTTEPGLELDDRFDVFFVNRLTKWSNIKQEKKLQGLVFAMIIIDCSKIGSVIMIYLIFYCKNF